MAVGRGESERIEFCRLLADGTCLSAVCVVASNPLHLGDD
jgi:hypothetical protein